MNISREMMTEMDRVYAQLDEKCSEIACALTHRMFKLRSGCGSTDIIIERMTVRGA